MKFQQQEKSFIYYPVTIATFCVFNCEGAATTNTNSNRHKLLGTITVLNFTKKIQNELCLVHEERKKKQKKVLREGKDQAQLNTFYELYSVLVKYKYNNNDKQRKEKDRSPINFFKCYFLFDIPKFFKCGFHKPTNQSTLCRQQLSSSTLEYIFIHFTIIILLALSQN